MGAARKYHLYIYGEFIKEHICLKQLSAWAKLQGAPYEITYTLRSKMNFLSSNTFNAYDVEVMEEMQKSGLSFVAIAKKFQASAQTITKYLKNTSTYGHHANSHS